MSVETGACALEIGVLSYVVRVARAMHVVRRDFVVPVFTHVADAIARAVARAVVAVDRRAVPSPYSVSVPRHEWRGSSHDGIRSEGARVSVSRALAVQHL